MRLYDKEKINKILTEAKGKSLDFIYQHEYLKLDQLKAKFFIDNFIVEVAKILEAREKEER